MRILHLTTSACLVLGLVACGGEDGEVGPTGPAGDAGPAGDSGPVGATGPAGDPGATGPQGDAGVQGPAGDAGADWPGPAPAAYAAADGIKGGAAYSEWFGTNGAGKGTLALYSVTTGAEFVRCKSCHGWDGLGTKGSYANRTGLSTGTATRRRR